MIGIKAGEIRVTLGNQDSPDFFSIKAERRALSKLAKHPNICLNFGTSFVYAKLMASPEKASYNRLLVSKDIFKQLFVPDSNDIGVSISQNKVVFGPLIGIFVSGWETENLAQGTCKNKYFYRYIKVCRELNAICCFFSLQDISWEERKIKGWIFQDKAAAGKKWTSRLLPIPTVVYDRCFGARGKEDGYELRSQLLNVSGVTVFNAMPKLRKWETYELLRTYPEIQDCLPKTLPYTGAEELAELLTKPGRVYLKPDGLSKGKGIFTIGRSPSGGFTIRHRGPEANEIFRIDSLDELEKLFEPYIERGGGYLMQEEVPLARYNGKKFDMRVLCQKDIDGQWIIGGIAVRVAARRSIVTSPRSGGSVITWPHALQSVFSQQQDQPDGIASKVTDIAFRICGIIEQHFGCCGELGLDMGIDDQGKVWVIEVNAKPLKVSLKRLRDPELLQLVHANPIRFAYFLGCKPYPGAD
ncbi:MAG TPA: YheC/YheD family protein [Desulfobacteria bacterium]|nr:YheC/YheD family protein [Desulfobacteria bacterium]